MAFPTYVIAQFTFQWVPLLPLGSTLTPAPSRHPDIMSSKLALLCYVGQTSQIDDPTRAGVKMKEDQKPPLQLLVFRAITPAGSFFCRYPFCRLEGWGARSYDTWDHSAGWRTADDASSEWWIGRCNLKRDQWFCINILFKFWFSTLQTTILLQGCCYCQWHYTLF